VHVRRLGVVPREVAGVGQSMAGEFVVDGADMCFVPRHPFVDGVVYALTVDGVVAATILRPAAAVATTVAVTAIYPSCAGVPLNLLRLYAHFSAPVREGLAQGAVELCREDTGETIEGAFLHMEPELWDRDHRRLTVLLDPGRIKRGLVPNQEAGYPLVEGVPVILRVGSSAARRYAVGPPVRARVDPALWRWEVPAAGSVDPLILGFDRPLDHALLRRCLWITDAAGLRLQGTVSIGDGEQSWRFEPVALWDAEPKVLVVDATLEDVAGNSVARVFDRDLDREEDAPLQVRRLRYDFACGV
jgi:hypothetical protein